MAVTSADVQSGVTVREHPVMRWGSIWAGWLVAVGVALGLYAFGLGVGFSAIDPNDAGAVARGVSAGTIVWVILTWAASLWIGSMVASWFDGRNDTEMGVVRGLTVWGLSMAATGLVLTVGLAHASAAAAAASANPPIDPALHARYIAAAMWMAFGCTVVSLLASVFGGWLGARHVHHVYHLRQYTPHGR
ncbi:MAG: hypothetical protein ACREUG_00840 [Steroidobacteraceae bacterium]